MSIGLMDPYGWPDCPIPECGNTKGKGYLTCADHRLECPDGDCRGSGWKTTGQEICRDCYDFFSRKLRLGERESFWVYMLDNNYIGMTSNPAQRLDEHIKHRSRYIKGNRRRLKDSGARPVYWSEPIYDWKLALRCEWGLDYMLDIAIDYHGQRYYANRFTMITGISASVRAIKLAPNVRLPNT